MNMDLVYKLFLGYVIGNILVLLLAIAVVVVDKIKTKNK